MFRLEDENLCNWKENVGCSRRCCWWRWPTNFCLKVPAIYHILNVYLVLMVVVVMGGGCMYILIIDVFSTNHKSMYSTPIMKGCCSLAPCPCSHLFMWCYVNYLGGGGDAPLIEEAHYVVKLFINKNSNNKNGIAAVRCQCVLDQ